MIEASQHRPATPQPQGGFAAAAPYYRQFRSAYSPELFDRVREACALPQGARMLDLGCGPGTLAIPFSEHCSYILAIDPEPAMIEEGRRGCAAANVEFRVAGSDDLSPAMGRFDLVTIGRAFHWMDRAEVLRRLDSMIEPDGAVALFAEPVLAIAENSWKPGHDRVIAAYRREVEIPPPPDSGASEEGLLLASPFRRMGRVSTIKTARTPVESLVGRAFSTPGTTPAELDERAAEFRQALVEALAPFATAEGVLEISEPQALIARRP
ncbi:MAG TPA: class I SAM-dependent methyltransferase [Allosphingosinicella sp.]